MPCTKRRFLTDLAALTAVGSVLPTRALAQSPAASFPVRPLRIVVPNAPGGGADLTARAVAAKLATTLGQPVVIENKPSAGGIVAGEQVARSAADGHTLLLISAGSAVSAALFAKLPFDTLADFAPVSMMAHFDLAIAVAQNSRFRTMAELLSWARANPGQLNIGTPQIGTTQNLAAELFKQQAGIEAQTVPFNGTPPVIAALRSGQIDMMVDILGPLMPQIRGQALRPLAVLGSARAADLPEVPTVRESGGALAQFDVSSWNGLAVPAKTPPAIIEQLSRAVQSAVAQPDVKQQLQGLNFTAKGSTPAQLREQLSTEIQRWGDVIASAKINRL